ncbi:TonB-dependent receptor plug domain-containing protein [Janthinobacterium fluminis]|uniref:TonB-dependent receptor n=1 Tax=Janthinobacterium fluminis TaxID=2987524 RepID=A0ABT5JU92_9BURK|nr:TonB-dependent receptor [Janthinobacterium fluminis]MDC8756149.1 TonB-dependent receptor [Janthinobacterium fluminis]
MRKPTRALWLALAVAACWPAARAQDAAPTLEQLLRRPLTEVPRDVEVSTSSRFAESAAQAPSLTYVVTDADIARHGLRSMGDILRTMPGLFVSGDGNFSYVGARGLGRPGDFNARLLFLVDGMRVNENIYDAALLGSEFFVDVELIERVEFAPGPGSALYGNNAFLGVVNVITKGTDKLAGAQFSAGVDSNRRRQMRASWGRRTEGGVEGWLALSAFRQDRIDADIDVSEADRGPIAAHNWDRGERLLGMARAGGWTLRGGLSRRVRGLPALMAVPDGFQFAQERGIYDNSFVALAHERALGEHWSLYGAVSAKRSAYQTRFPYLREGLVPSEFAAVAVGRWLNVDLRLSTRRWRDHDLMAGVEYQFDRQQTISHGTVGEEPLGEFFGDNRRRGLFVQDAWRLGDTHRLILGLRRDQAMLGGSNNNPRLAWVWSGVADATLKLMYGSAFREANLYEFQINAPFEAPIPTPERVRTLELAWEHALTPRLQYRVSLYGSRLRGLISVSPETGVFENSGAIRNVGAELGLERRWDGGEQLRLSLSLQESKDAQDRRLSNSPRALLKLLYSQPLAGDALRLSWQALGVSRRGSAAQDLPGYALVNATLLWRADPDTELSLGLYNMANTRYVDRPGLLGPPLRQEGRALRFALTRRFGS